MARGKRPSAGSFESCASALGLLGAVLSATTSHLGAPPAWVMAEVQPGGSAPAGAESKLKVWAAPRSGKAPSISMPAARAVHKVDRFMCRLLFPLIVLAKA